MDFKPEQQINYTPTIIFDPISHTTIEIKFHLNILILLNQVFPHIDLLGTQCILQLLQLGI